MSEPRSTAYAVGDLVRPAFKPVTGQDMIGEVTRVDGEHRVTLNWRVSAPGYRNVAWDTSSLIRCRANDLRPINARFDGKCRECGKRIPRGLGVYYSPSMKAAFHVDCA